MIRIRTIWTKTKTRTTKTTRTKNETNTALDQRGQLAR